MAKTSLLLLSATALTLLLAVSSSAYAYKLVPWQRVKNGLVQLPAPENTLKEYKIKSRLHPLSPTSRLLSFKNKPKQKKLQKWPALTSKPGLIPMPIKTSRAYKVEI
ncbi:hypothetical protein [Polycladidibacter stylochi]|uniref:hypothetical protein n=1 Tax=Polycladidibacter stylochi TaxID=1807766 RepID=UPI0008311DD1|nr:hypothetical protein [Pseudovibrio stylochi]